MRDDQRQAFVDVAGAELAGLRKFAYALVGDWHRADDLVQSAFERMYVAWPRLDVNDVGAYARTVLVRCAATESRRARWKRERVTDQPPSTVDDDHAPGTTDRIDLATALSGLTVKQRAVVALRYLEDRPVNEVADILGIAAGTVKRQCSDALARLRQHLGEPAAPEQGGQRHD